MKVSEDKLLNLPITDFLKAIPKGRQQALRAVRFSREGLCGKFLRKFYATSEKDRNLVPLEAIAIAAGVDVGHLWGEIMLALREISVNTVKLVAVVRHPEVMNQRIENALLPGGVRDRDAIDTMLGALPSRQGPTFINKFFAGKVEEAEPGEPAKPATEEMVDDLEYLFPDSSVMQEKLQPIRQKLLKGD